MSKFTKAVEFKLSDEAALDQVQILTGFYGIDPDAKSNPEAGEATETLLTDLHRFVRLGWVEINTDASVVQHLQSPPGEVDKIKYRRINGNDTIAATRGGKEGEWNSKLFALLSAVGDVGDGVRKLTGPDLKVAEVLGALFFSR